MMSKTKTKSGKTGKTLLLALLLTSGGGGGGWYYYSSKQEKPITVQTEKVGRRNLTELVVANGKIQPVIMVKISPEVSGEIIDLPVKEGQLVKKGDLLFKIKPDFYQANRASAEASYKSSVANKALAAANLDKTRQEHARFKQMFSDKLVSESQFLEAKTAMDVAAAQAKAAEHQTEVAQATLDRASDDLSKTTVVAPLDGTISRLNSQKGERVVGTATMAGTEIMTISDLNEMEARVDIGEIDVVLICVGQVARLEVDAYHDRKFTGTVTDIANTARVSNPGQQAEATKFEVRIRVAEKEIFRPGMSVTSEIETRYRTNVLSVPIQCVTIRLPKGVKKDDKMAKKQEDKAPEKLDSKGNKKQDESQKPIEVVFLLEGDEARMVPVKRGIGDEQFVEITEGLKEGQVVVSGGYKAINRELEDGKKLKVENNTRPPGTTTAAN
jgi:HlyD family secretion protein